MRAAACLALLIAAPLSAQDTTTVNIYRFVLGVDVPESPAFVALGVAPTHVLRGSAPKPIAASVLDAFLGGDQATPGVAVDVSPYFLLGGGVRRRSRLHAMSLGGRLARVFTKTIVSVGAAREPSDPASPRLGFALRSTIHDPHDPLLNTTLAEDVARELARRGIPDSVSTDEDVGDRGADLAPLYARARRAMRGRTGDVQFSAGWGVALRVANGVLARDSVGTARHTIWLSGQLTPTRRLDLLTTVQLRNAFRSDARAWLGAGLQRKTTALDYRVELYYDTKSHDLHPGVAVEARVWSRMGFVAALSSQQRQLRFQTLVHWFYASDGR
jgi:hypothetical protein